MDTKDILTLKTKDFALDIIKICNRLIADKKEYVLARQLLRSGTSIGANVREAKYSESKLDFIHKLKISLKESNESEYWLELLFESNLISESDFTRLHSLNKELLKLLISSINTLKKKFI